MTDIPNPPTAAPTELPSTDPLGFARLEELGLGVGKEVRQAVKGMMAEELPGQFIASCVRTRSFSEWGGGLKSTLVGRLELSVVTGLKLGGAELHRDAAIMRAINAAGKPICIEPLKVTDLQDGRTLLLMEGLEKHSPLLDVVYRTPIPASVQDRLMARVVAALAQIRKVAPRELADAGVHTLSDPYSSRLRDKLLGTLVNDGSLGLDARSLLDRPGILGGETCPPVSELVDAACEWLSRSGTGIPVLAHGDLHLKNVLVRRRGSGYSFRFIDPNGDLGFTDMLYDIGKLLHWAEELGWSQVDPRACRVSWTPSTGGRPWSLSAQVVPPSTAAERRRQRLQASILASTRHLLRSPESARRIHLSVASAHAGLVSLYAAAGQASLARFAAFFALRSLLRWRSCQGRS